MKNLATCNPIEFFTQTNKIRRAVENWLTLTKVLEIRKRLPEVDKTATKEQRQAALMEQIEKNMGVILDSVLEDHPVETAQVLGLCCFVEPEDLEKYQMREFLGAFTEMITCPEVVGFFTSLAQLAGTGTSNSAKAQG